jgi:uncharacterized phiE125 gp8 family phage protein
MTGCGGCNSVDGSTNRPWDFGITWHLELIDGPDLDNDDTLTLAVVRDQHARGANGTAEDEYLERLRKVSYHEAEEKTGRALLQQTWDLVMSGFPLSYIEVPKPPLQSVVSIEYTDDSGDTQQLLTSPVEVQVVAPTGPKAGKGRIYPGAGASWPSTLSNLREAVRIRFTAGYPLTEGSPASADVPIELDQARLLVIGEYYKSRSESVVGTVPAMRLAKSTWERYRVDGRFGIA